MLEQDKQNFLRNLLSSSQTNFLQGLIFVVDSNDRERIEEAADELQKMVSVDAFWKKISFLRFGVIFVFC